MASTPLPAWQAHEAPGYDAAMTSACDALLLQLRSDPTYRQAIPADPRTIHGTLFAPFVHIECPEYAGTYRGTPGTMLEHRTAGAPRLFTPNEMFSFEPPAAVPEGVSFLLSEIQRELPLAREAAPYDQLQLLTDKP